MSDADILASAPARQSASWHAQLPTLIRVYGIILTLVLLLAVVTIGNPAFISQQNIFNMASQWAPAGIMAVGMTFVILTGGFDLSVASAYSLCAVVAAYVGQTHAPSIAFAAAIAIGLVFGLANGILVAVVRINPFITTVGNGFIINGVALVMTQNAAFLVDNEDFAILGAGRWHGVPYSGMLLVIFLVVFGFVLARTIYGEAIYAVGGNYEASRLSGIRVKAVVASTYVLMGGCVGLAGSIAASQLSSAQANLDPGIIFDVLTIVVVGGTSLSGGSGAMWRTAVGLGIIATISNGFVLLDISPYYQSIIKGSIIVAALALDTGLTRLVRAEIGCASPFPRRGHFSSTIGVDHEFQAGRDNHPRHSRRLPFRTADLRSAGAGLSGSNIGL
jgi:ribose transport system permease protein